MSKLSYADALSAVLALAAAHSSPPHRVEDEELAPGDAVGRLLAAPVLAPRPLPAFDNSAMDGFCVSSAHTAHASPEHPLVLRVIGSIAAGDPPPIYDADTPPDACYEIMTGAPFPHPREPRVPRRLDACVRVEHVQPAAGELGALFAGAARIVLTAPARPDQERRRAGEDYDKGDLAADAGTVITPEHIMAFAALDVRRLRVRPRVRVAVITTGKELAPLADEAAKIASADAPAATASSTIANSNGPYLAAALASWGHAVTSVAAVGDEPSALADALHAAAATGAHAVLTTGGVSAGKHDHVRGVLAALRAKFVVGGVRMRPGGPACVAEWAATDAPGAHPVAVFGLPGNPSAAALAARVLAEPYLRALAGLSPERPLFAQLRAAAGAPASGHTGKALACAVVPVTVGTEKMFTAEATTASTILLTPLPLRRFIPAALHWTARGPEVRMRRVSGGVISGLVGADVWLSINEDRAISEGDWIECWLVSG
jgi:molybdopterin molybdotransferase